MNAGTMVRACLAQVQCKRVGCWIDARMTLLRRDYALDRRRANRVARAFRLAVSDSNLAGIRLSAADPRQRHPDGEVACRRALGRDPTYRDDKGADAPVVSTTTGVDFHLQHRFQGTTRLLAAFCKSLSTRSLSVRVGRGHETTPRCVDTDGVGKFAPPRYPKPIAMNDHGQ